MKPGLLAALLGSVGSASLAEVNHNDIKGEHARMLPKYLNTTMQTLIGEKIEQAKREGSSSMELPSPRWANNVEEDELRAVALIYSVYSGTIVEITPQRISISNKQKQVA